jgi:hypothetical protein
LEHGLSQRLAADGFTEIGHYTITGTGEGRRFNYTVENAAANLWRFSIYAYVSLAGGGKVIRIGKCQAALQTRLNSYVYHIGGAIRSPEGLNEQFKGSTPPWERDGWLEYTLPQGRGLIFAQSMPALSSEAEAKLSLRTREAALIQRYDPPLCNDSPAGRKRKADWLASHGRPRLRYKRDG